MYQIPLKKQKNEDVHWVRSSAWIEHKRPKFGVGGSNPPGPVYSIRYKKIHHMVKTNFLPLSSIKYNLI